MKFCSQCGSSQMSFVIPSGDNRPRHCCSECDAIFYENPKIVAGCIAQWGDQVLMCKRAIEPRHGKWTLPAGFMENQETVHAAAARETHEEATAQVNDLRLYAFYNLPHINQVYMMFVADLVDGKASPGTESLEVALMKEEEIPWGELAFPVITESLKLYFEDRRRGDFPLRTGEIIRRSDQTLQITRY